jgi:hypothetical protein
MFSSPQNIIALQTIFSYDWAIFQDPFLAPFYPVCGAERGVGKVVPVL